MASAGRAFALTSASWTLQTNTDASAPRTRARLCHSDPYSPQPKETVTLSLTLHFTFMKWAGSASSAVVRINFDIIDIGSLICLSSHHCYYWNSERLAV